MIMTPRQANLLNEIDEYVHKLTGDEGEDDSWTVLKQYVERLRRESEAPIRIVCPHCNEEMEDSQEWGCPDTDWEEDGQCPYCEGEFRWARTLHHCTYTVTKK